MKKPVIFSTAITVILFLLFLPFIYQLTFYLHPIAIATVFLCLWFLTTFLTFLVCKMTINIPYPVFLGAFILYSATLIILLFFRPTSQYYGTYNLVPFSTIEFFLTGKVNLLISFYNLAANIVLFLPYGISTMLWKPTKKINYIYLPIVFISMIEILQYLTQRGNLDIDDLILNVIGVFLGYLLYPVFRQVIKITVPSTTKNQLTKL
jgi:glycopeptide antibiotics resistance protein